jgi:hypothetical protein
VYAFPSTRSSETADIREFVERVRSVTAPDARVALTEVGTFGFYSERYVVDLDGLVDPSALAWLRGHGAARTIGELEDLAIARGAQYYVDTAAEPEGIRGQRLEFVPMVQRTVQRNNFSEGRLRSGLWRLYRLGPKLPGGRPGG